MNESFGGVLFKIREDPRITKVGRILRKYSIDELPQFFNVLRRDMSVVGPRPPLKREVDTYDDLVRRRLLVLPGITGLWQVSGRSDLQLGGFGAARPVLCGELVDHQRSPDRRQDGDDSGGGLRRLLDCRG